MPATDKDTAMLGLTPLGTVHTAISLVAVAAGLVSFFRYREILPTNWLGQTYIWTTVLTCVTGFGIFQHGGFNKAHVLGIITLVMLGVAWVARRTNFYGRASRYVETVAYSLTFFFHMVPAFTETATRLPQGAPLVSGPDAPGLQMAIAGAFAVFLIGATLQILRLRAMRGQTAPVGALPR
jgi:uncharacterized membrane protein